MSSKRKIPPQKAPASREAVVPQGANSVQRNSDAQQAMGAAPVLSSAALRGTEAFVFAPEQLAALLDLAERTRQTGDEHSISAMRDFTDDDAPYRFVAESVQQGQRGSTPSYTRQGAEQFARPSEEAVGSAHTHPNQGPGSGPLQRHAAMPSPTDVDGFEAQFAGQPPTADGDMDFFEMVVGVSKDGPADVLIVSCIGGQPIGAKDIHLRPRPANVEALARRLERRNPTFNVWYGPLEGPIERVTP